jgi:guanylate kinase
LNKGGRRQNHDYRKGSIVIISAPSGAGKSTVVRHILSSMPDLRFSISHTTRSPRAREKNGREYFFVSTARFKKMVAAGEFVEWARVYGNLYGTSRLQLQQARQKGENILLDIDVQGHREVRRRLPEAISVFLLPPSYDELKNRLIDRRSDSAGAIQKRLSAALEEISHWPEYDYIVINHKANQASEALRDIIKAARFHRKSCREEIQQICKTFGG